jgi:hypothetical protein
MSADTVADKDLPDGGLARNRFVLIRDDQRRNTIVLGQ